MNNSNYQYLKKCNEVINKMGSNIDYTTDSMEVITTMKNIYSYIKEICHTFYNKSNNSMEGLYEDYIINDIYRFILNKINFKYYIISTDNLYHYDKDYNLKINKSINFYDEESILQFIVHEAFKEYQDITYGFYIFQFESHNLTNKCKSLSSIVKKQCDLYNIPCEIVKIEAGYQKNSSIFSGYRFHYFNIVELGNKKYIVDCTYRQFFALKGCILESLGVPYFSTPYPGYFMMMNSERKLVAKEILKNCYIIITPENLKHYLDGYTLSFRNGLYYETYKDLSYTTPYTYEDYIKFLYSDISLLDYEKNEVIGYQKKPLYNPKFDFTKK